MKKSFLLIPIAAAVLSACTTNKPAPVESVDGSLSPGVMQPVDNTGATGSTWEPQVQQGTMPVGMDAPVVQQPVASQVQIPQPAQTPVSQPVQQTAQATAQHAAAQVSQDFEIPRNPQTNAPDYSKIDKGFYKGSSYTVRKGDTMFLIAYISGMDVKELAAMNNMSEPYNLGVGQVLKLGNNKNVSTAAPTTTAATPTVQPQPVVPEVTYTSAPNGTQYGSDGTITGPIKAGVGTAKQPGNVVSATAGTMPTATPVEAQPTINQTAPPPANSSIAWKWPTNGKIIQGFSNADGGNKGIDISGSKGQAVYAAAGGRVVYAGNALRGYGNLIIIKHNDDFLSAYAHNDSISVKDQQDVRAGDQIAQMGSTGTNSVKLHFEIRYKGKSVDPVRYLPRR